MADPSQTSADTLVVGETSTHPFLQPGEAQPDLTGCPCVIINHYNGHTANKFSTITVPKGAKGIVKSVSKNWTYVDVVLLQDQPGVGVYRGWVAARVVKVAYKNQHGQENTIRTGINLTTLGGLTATVTNVTFTSSPTCQVLTRFWMAIWNGRRVLTCINQRCLDAINKYQGPEALARKVFSDISRDSPGVIQQLDSGGPYTAQSINASCKAVFKDGWQSIYCKAYHGIPLKSTTVKTKAPAKTKQEKIPGFYVGVTQDPTRDKLHEKSFTDSTSTEYHYNYVRGATDRRFRHMVVFEHYDLRPLYEQSVICLFESQAYFIKEASSSASFDAIGDNEGDLSDLGELADRKIQGRVFYEIFNQAKAKVPAFRGGCDDPAFHAVGLNDMSPLCEVDTAERSIWTLVVVPGRFAEYRRRVSRSRVTTTRQPNDWQFNILFGAGRGQDSFKCTISRTKDGKDVIPPDGTDFDIVVQVPEREQRHPNAWARLPTIGPFKNWKKVAGTGIGIQWTNDKEELVGVWLQAKDVYSPIKDPNDFQPVGAWWTYAKVEALIRALEQREISHAPFWMKHMTICRILEVSYDYLAQTWTEKEKFPSAAPSVYVQSNWNKDAATINAELVAVFGSAAINQASDKTAGRKDSTCSRCIVQKGSADTGRPRNREIPAQCGWSVKPDGTCSCETCRTWGTPCVNVDRDTLLRSNVMMNALAPPLFKPLTLIKLQDSRLLLSNTK